MKKGHTLMEESFCQLIALGMTARAAYSMAFSVALTDKQRVKSVDNRAYRLKKRADIVARIKEASLERKLLERRKWEARGETLANDLFEAIMQRKGEGKLLSAGALKGIEVLAKMKGFNAPEETVLKNGGMADDFTPRGIQGMSDEDLKSIIEIEEAKG